MEPNISEIVKHFRTKGEFLSFEKNTIGHINDSYRVTTSAGDHPGYFLQWINNYIFKDIEGLMNNISAVTSHLAEKLKENENLNFQVLEIVPCKNGMMFFHDPEGQYWRMYTYIDKMHVYDVVDNNNIAFEGGNAFGTFMWLLADLPADRLHETIPDFHNMGKRLDAFYKSIITDPADRVKVIGREIDFVKKRAGQMLTIPEMINQGKLPRRITHNDTKFNNILFDSSEKAICIVDLDTVMPGSILFDFGDAIRTVANTAVEDERNLSKVDINLSIYEAYTKGFIKSLKHTLTDTEINNLAFSARFMTYIIGLRFLTDFVDGDLYFRTHSAEHNLDRAKVQFRLLEKMELNADKMHNIIIQSLKHE
jgi:hypothetical protein